MVVNSQRPKGRDSALSSLNAAIGALNFAKEASCLAPAQAIFGSVSVLLTMIRDSMINRNDLVELGLACANVCKVLDRGIDGRGLDQLGQSVCEAIAQFTTTVAGIQERIIGKRGRNVVSRVLHAKGDKETIAAWRLDLNRILHVFNTELAINNLIMVADLRRHLLESQEGTDRQHPSGRARSAISSAMGSTPLLLCTIPPGVLPPQPPRACFGRDELIEKIVGLTETFTPVALVGPGGIGKTSIALTVLHHDRIKERFGDNRRFIRCDQFPASRTHFLNQLSKAVGAGVENPEDLTPLRYFLSTREMILFLDNAESILDSPGASSQEIYAVVKELSRFKTISLCITSRVSTILPDCKRLDIPTLSTDAARRAFYHIYDDGEPSNLVNDILKQLDFHPLSITLLATVAHHNKWGTDRLNREWKRQRTGVLHARHNRSLAATIELSLASPTFQELGPDARDLLGVVAFFPQGVDEDNLNWLFPTIPDITKIFDTFCTLSLTYRSNGFVTMLAPLRDYLSPKIPTSSPLLCTIKDCYFRRLSVSVHPDKPGYEEARWIMSEDVNTEHLIDVFTPNGVNSIEAWAACCNFMEHLHWHKPRPIMLGPKVEGLPDGHPSKPQCLLQLSWSFVFVGNYAERKRLLVRALEIWKERGDGLQIARTLTFLAEANGLLDLRKEGLQQVGEALEIYERLGDTSGQAHSLQFLAFLLRRDNQLNAAEDAISRAIDLLPGEGENFRVCRCHRLLGSICRSKGKIEEAINHYRTALRIASSFNWPRERFWSHYHLGHLLSMQGSFDDAHIQIERAKPHAINTPFHLGRAMRLQAQFWHQQNKFEEAKSEALRAADTFEKIGAAKDAEDCRAILRNIESQMKNLIIPGESNSDARGIE